MGVNTQFGTDLPQLARYLVYINGVRVPASSVSVSVGVFQPMQAEIELAPHRLIMRLGAEDRAQVAVFYLDSWYDKDRPRWCLLFEGQITGWSYVARGDSRKLLFQVQSNLAILTQLFMYFLSGESASIGRKAKSDSDYPNQLKMKGKYPWQLFTAGLTGKTKMSRPFDIIENILYAVLGEHRGKVRDLTTGSKDVKTELARLRALVSANIDGKIARAAKVAVDREDPSGTLSIEERKAKLETAEGWYRSIVEDNESFRLVSEAVSLAPNELSRLQKLTNSKDKQTAALEILAKETLTRRSLLSKSITQTGYFARYMRLTRFLEHWVASPFMEGIPGMPNPVSGMEGGGVFPLLRAVKAKKVFKAIAKQAGTKFGPNANTWNLLHSIFSFLYYEIVEVLAPPAMTVDKYSLPSGSFYEFSPEGFDLLDNPLATDEIIADITEQELSEVPNGYNAWGSELALLKNRLCIGSYLTKPQVYFGLPPSCNVFFPSMWSDWQYEENYASQPTRVYFNRKGPMKKLSMGSGTPGYAYSNTRVGFPAVVERHIQDASATSSSDMEFLVFPEEYYRGPSPLLQNVPTMFTNIQKVANSRRFSRHTAEEEKLEYQISKEQDAAGNAIYAERAALTIRTSESASKKGHSMHALYFLLAQQEYYKSRYQGNSGGVAGVFNPYVVVGFPMTVFDRDSMGLNVIGTAMSVTHSLSESGLSSSVTLNFGRTFEEMFAALQSDGAALDIAPQNPVSEIQDVFQYMPTANQYYGMLFRAEEIGVITSPEQAAETLSRNARSPAVMDYRMLVGWNIDGDPDNNRIFTRPLSAAETAFFEEHPDYLEATMEDTDTGVRLNTPVAPLTKVRPLWDSTQTALRYCSRPVCTLEQYIDFYAVAGRGTAGLDPEGRGRGIRVGARNEGAGIPTYYNVIRQFIGGPGVEPGSKLSAKDDTGAPQGTLELDTIGSDGAPVKVVILKPGQKAKFGDLPDSRKDWQALLLDYVASISDPNPLGAHSTKSVLPPLA